MSGIVARDQRGDGPHRRERLDALKAAVPKFSYQRNSIYLSLCHADYDKGTALAELGRLIGVGPEGTFAIGDHQNDLPMLNGVHARHVACPANAIEEVKRVVSVGGWLRRAGRLQCGRHRGITLLL